MKRPGYTWPCLQQLCGLQAGGRGNDVEVKLALTLRPAPEELPPVRHKVQFWLDAAGVPRPAAEDVTVVISELVTNGIVHDGGDDIEVTITVDDSGGVAIEVVSTDRPAHDNRPDPRAISDPTESGRGLGIVSALTEEMVVEERSGRRHVMCHMAFAN